MRTARLLRVIMVMLVCTFAALSTTSAYAQGDEKILQLKNMIIDLQNKGALGFKNVAICSNIIGLGSYVPLAEPKIKLDGELLVYYEPVNIFTNRVQDQYEIMYSQDMILLSEDKQLLFESKKALKYNYRGKSPIFDLYVTNSLNLEGAPAGKYIYKMVLYDGLKNAQAEYFLPFEIVE